MAVNFINLNEGNQVRKETRGRPKLKPGSGRVKDKNPSKRVWTILELIALGNPLALIAREYECTRQYIYQLKKRWLSQIIAIEMGAIEKDQPELDKMEAERILQEQNK